MFPLPSTNTTADASPLNSKEMHLEVIRNLSKEKFALLPPAERAALASSYARLFQDYVLPALRFQNGLTLTEGVTILQAIEEIDPQFLTTLDQIAQDSTDTEFKNLMNLVITTLTKDPSIPMWSKRKPTSTTVEDVPTELLALVMEEVGTDPTQAALPQVNQRWRDINKAPILHRKLAQSFHEKAEIATQKAIELTKVLNKMTENWVDTAYTNQADLACEQWDLAIRYRRSAVHHAKFDSKENEKAAALALIKTRNTRVRLQGDDDGAHVEAQETVSQFLEDFVAPAFKSENNFTPQDGFATIDLLTKGLADVELDWAVKNPDTTEPSYHLLWGIENGCPLLNLCSHDNTEIRAQARQILKNTANDCIGWGHFSSTDAIELLVSLITSCSGNNKEEQDLIESALTILNEIFVDLDVCGVPIEVSICLPALAKGFSLRENYSDVVDTLCHKMIKAQPEAFMYSLGRQIINDQMQNIDWDPKAECTSKGNRALKIAEKLLISCPNFFTLDQREAIATACIGIHKYRHFSKLGRFLPYNPELCSRPSMLEAIKYSKLLIRPVNYNHGINGGFQDAISVVSVASHIFRNNPEICRSAEAEAIAESLQGYVLNEDRELAPMRHYFGERLWQQTKSEALIALVFLIIHRSDIGQLPLDYEALLKPIADLITSNPQPAIHEAALKAKEIIIETTKPLSLGAPQIPNDAEEHNSQLRQAVPQPITPAFPSPSASPPLLAVTNVAAPAVGSKRPREEERPGDDEAGPAKKQRLNSPVRELSPRPASPALEAMQER